MFCNLLIQSLILTSMVVNTLHLFAFRYFDLSWPINSDTIVLHHGSLHNTDKGREGI